MLRVKWLLVSAAAALVVSACSSSSTNVSSSGADGGSSNGGGGGDGGGGGGGPGGGGMGGGGSPCTDTLATGLVAMQTSVSVDAFDCQILKWTAQYNEPDPMIFKAIIYVESRFDQKAVACPNMPCGTPMGWTSAESGCYGLMQIVPACGDDPNNAGLMANGHPNMTTDTSSADWPGSIFNPDVNIECGIAGIANNRMQVKQKFAGCTEDQYTMMAIGDYNSYGSTKSCTDYNKQYDDLVLMAYTQYAMAAGYAAHAY